MQRITKKEKQLGQHILSIFPGSRKFYFPQRATEVFALRQYQSVRIYKKQDMMYFQFFENGDGDYKLYHRAGVEITSSPPFRTLDLKRGHYYMHKEANGFLRVNITQPLDDKRMKVLL